MTFFQGPSTAAEISVRSFDADDQQAHQSLNHNFGRPFILIEGEIRPGDLVQLESAAQTLSSIDAPLVVLLDSPGGNIAEALRISDFIRMAWGTTWLKGRSSLVKETDRSINVCYSACAIIFFSGIERRYTSENHRYYAPDDPHFIPQEYQSKDSFLKSTIEDFLRERGAEPDRSEVIPVLGLHRPYFEASYNRTLTGEEASVAYSDLAELVQDKMESYGVPSATISLMMKTSSQEIVEVGMLDLYDLIPQIEPWFEEWNLARCSALSAQEKMDLLISAAGARDSATRASTKVTPNYSEGYLSYLESKSSEIEKCKLSALLEQQKLILDSAPSPER